MYLSNVQFQNNTNRGGSAGLVVQGPSCDGVVELLDVAFKENVYSKASVLARENTLTDVRVVGNRRIANNNQETSFFCLPDNSSSKVTKMTAKDNANAGVLYVERGELNVSSSLFQNNAGKRNAVVETLSSSLIVRETRFLDNFCKCRAVAVFGRQLLSFDFLSCTFAGNVADGKDSGVVYATNPRVLRFFLCDFADNVIRSSNGMTVALDGLDSETKEEGREITTVVEFLRCRFLRNAAAYVTAVRLSEVRARTVLFHSCHLQNNTTPDDSPVHRQTVVLVKDSFLHNLTMANCTFESNDCTRHVLSLFSANGTFWIRNTSFADNRTPQAGQGSTLNVQRRTVSNEHLLAQSASDNGAVLSVEDSEFRRNGGDLAGGAVHVADEQTRVELLDSRFLDNRAEKGGAVFVENARLVDIDNCTFARNSATDVGGAIRLQSGSAEIRKCTFVENTGEHGGAIDTMTNILVQDSEFFGNKASIRGGAMSIRCLESFPCKPRILGSAFWRNRAG